MEDLDTWNHGGAWNRWQQGLKLQIMNDEDRMHNNQHKENMQRVSPISAEDYLRNEISKNNRLNEFINCFALNQHEHLRNMRTKGKDTSLKLKQHQKHTNTDQSGEIMYSGNKQKDMQELKKHTHETETVTTMRSRCIT